MKTDLVLLPVLMGAVTYPWRAVPLLMPGVDRLPPLLLGYLRLVGPAVLATLAAVSVAVVLDEDRNGSFHVGVEWLAVALCVALVARFNSLLAGLVFAAVLVALLRSFGVAQLP
jgi:branched-subunit amino acid transport protein